MSSSSIAPVNNFETNSRRARDVAETRTSRGRAQRETTGRYDGQRARMLPSGLGRPAPSHNVRTAVANVVDPYGNGVGRIQAAVNRNVDILELERSHGRISEGAYLTGRIVQAALEKASTVSGTNWAGGDRKDAKLVSDTVAYKAIETAQQIEGIMNRMAARIGMIDARLLRRILGDRMTFAQCSEAVGRKADKHGSQYMGTRFRDALEDLTEGWTAKGAHQVVADDKHLAAAETMVDRQRLSMVKGVTTARRADEAREAAKRAEMARKANPARR